MQVGFLPFQQLSTIPYISQKMVLNDLPNELWQDIQQYIPRSQRRKLIGVSRFFFEQAMDSLYAEVHLIDDDGQTMKSFEQIL